VADDYVDDVRALEAESALQRQDIENLQNQIEDLKEEARKLQQELRWAQDYLLEEQARLLETTTRLEATERALEQEKQRSQSLRLHGGEHWFVYGYQRALTPTDSYTDFCSVCDKPRDDPSHFGNGVKALSSKDVEKAVETARGRVEMFLKEGMSMREETARAVATELLRGLPGLPPIGPESSSGEGG